MTNDADAYHIELIKKMFECKGDNLLIPEDYSYIETVLGFKARKIEADEVRISGYWYHRMSNKPYDMS